MALVLGNILVFLSLFGIGAWAGETFLRFTYVATDSFGVSLPARRWFALYTSLNSLGCRDKEWVLPKPQHLRRIAFIGDSFTYGWGIETVADRFTDRLQSLFDARQANAVELMNVAKPGWNTGDELQPLRDMVGVYGADEIVLCYVDNDIEDLLPTTEGFNPTRPPEPTFFNLDSSCLLDYLYRIAILPRSRSVAGYFDWLTKGYSEQAVWKKQEDRLEAMIGFCKSRNVPFRVALLPYVRKGDGYDAEAVHARVMRFLSTRDIPVVDLSSALRGYTPDQLVVHRNDTHPNVLANKLFADAIWNGFFAQ